jgi:uncharacterized membrane protein
MGQWLRRSFVTGFFVTVPLVISLVALAWVFRVVDGFVAPVYRRLIGFEVPGLGILTTAVLVLGIGVVATNVLGRRLLQRAEGYLMMVPVFRTVYSPVKQIVAAFSPDNEYGFRRVAVVEDAGRGQLLGFLTKEFVLDLGRGSEKMVAVYVPTNHLYLGDLVIVPAESVVYPDLSVEEGVRVILTGGMAIPERITGHRGTGGGANASAWTAGTTERKQP